MRAWSLSFYQILSVWGWSCWLKIVFFFFLVTIELQNHVFGCLKLFFCLGIFFLRNCTFIWCFSFCCWWKDVLEEILGWGECAYAIFFFATIEIESPMILDCKNIHHFFYQILYVRIFFFFCKLCAHLLVFFVLLLVKRYIENLFG